MNYICILLNNYTCYVTNKDQTTVKLKQLRDITVLNGVRLLTRNKNDCYVMYYWLPVDTGHVVSDDVCTVYFVRRVLSVSTPSFV